MSKEIEKMTPFGRRPSVSRISGVLVSLCALAALLAPTSANASWGDDFGIQPGSFWAGTCELPNLGTGQSPDPAYSSLEAQAAREARDCHQSSEKQPITATPVTQAGAHPDVTATFELNLNPSEPAGEVGPEGNAKDIIVDAPAGLIGNPQATPRCSQMVWATGLCPPDTQVGILELRISGTSGVSERPQGCPGAPNASTYPQFSFPKTTVFPSGETRCRYPIINVVPANGQLAAFGFNFWPANGIDVAFEPLLRSDGDYGVRLQIRNVAEAPELSLSTATLWGVPGSPSHDAFRFRGGSKSKNRLTPGQKWPTEGSEAVPIEPFLTNPTACEGSEPETTLMIDSWQDPGRLETDGSPDLSDPAWHVEHVKSPPVTGCSALPFEPTISIEPTVHEAETPTGMDVDLSLPQEALEHPEQTVTADLRNTTVKLPAGLTLTPAAANGLEACTSSQIGLTTTEGEQPFPIRFNESWPLGCPEASKIGTVKITTPLLGEAIEEGGIYLAAQKDNPFHSNYAIYLVAHSEARNITVKLAGEVKADPSTGQLSATFLNNPQVPFSNLELKFKGGVAAPLVTPQTCGTGQVESSLTSWAAPGAPVSMSEPFAVTAGVGGGACRSGEGEMPSAPSFEAGTSSPVAGAYSPFVLHLSRADGTQRFKALNVDLPPGLTGRLAGIPYCPESGIAQAQGRTAIGDGALERSNPSCPAASQVGTVTVGVGAGEKPLYVRGNAYLAGPYKGAPLSLVVITPAVAGPFDLGVVVVRAALFVNPETAQISVKSDPLPTILEGVPLDVRSIAVNIDKSDFTLNPTSCEAAALGGSVESLTGNTASVSNRFRVGSCEALPFKPSLKLQLKGATKRTGHPGLKAVLTAKPGEADISRAQVNLPHGEFLDQGNLNKTCTKPVLLEGKCPASSVYGKATAWTPLLEQPLQGNVYLVGGYGYKLPALVAELNGQVRVVLKGKVDSGPNKGIRNTFEAVPDAPVSRFVLEMKGGKKYGLLENSENLCKASKKERQAIVRFAGQNGKVEQFKPVVANQCGKKKARKSSGHGRG